MRYHPVGAVLDGERIVEITEKPRAPSTINVQGYEHDDDAAEILKKTAKALEHPSGLLPSARSAYSA